MDSRKPPVRRRPPIARPVGPQPPEIPERAASGLARWGWPHWVALGVCSFLGFLCLLFVVSVITGGRRAERDAGDWFREQFGPPPESELERAQREVDKWFPQEDEPPEEPVMGVRHPESLSNK